MPRFESTSSRARAFELCLKNRSIASLCKDCDDSIVSGRSSAFLGVLFSIRSHRTYRKTGEKETHEKQLLLPKIIRRALSPEGDQIDGLQLTGQGG